MKMKDFQPKGLRPPEVMICECLERDSCVG
jgi:hypothetical protein